MEKKTLPNILITGTPGTGKTTTTERIAETTGLKHINVTELISKNQFYTGRDEERDCYVVDEDKLCDYLEELLPRGGYVIDYHICDFFPERWFQLVVVLRADNTLLYERLEKKKI